MVLGIPRRGHVSRVAQAPSTGCEARKIKVVLLGAPRVGKTSLFRRILDQPLLEEYAPTVAADIGAKFLHLEGHPCVMIELWDIPHDAYSGSAIFTEYLKDSNAVVLVYDMTDPTSWQALAEYQRRLSPLPVIMVGNKADLLGTPSSADKALSQSTSPCALSQDAPTPLLHISAHRDTTSGQLILKTLIAHVTASAASLQSL